MTTDVDSKGAEEASSTTMSPATKALFWEVVSVSIPSVQPKGAVKSSVSPSKSTGKVPSELPSPPPSSNLRNPHLGKISLDYNELESFDQLIYSLQKGAPTHGNTLPLPWQTVKQALFDRGEITLDELNSEEATKWLKLRYECLRLGIEAFFKGKPEPTDKNHWTFFKYEKFDAFDKKPGRKYWRHQRHSIFSPTITTINARQYVSMEIAETADEKEGCGRLEAPTLYNHVITLKDQPTSPPIDHSKLGNCIINNGGLEGAGNHVGEGALQERKTPIIDLEWMDEDDTPVETMHGEQVVSSEGLMSREELEKIIVDFVDEPFSTRHGAEVAPLSEPITNNDQPPNHHTAPSHGAPHSSYTTHPPPAPPPSTGFQAITKPCQANSQTQHPHLPSNILKLKSANPTPNRHLQSQSTKTLPDPPQNLPIILSHPAPISQKRIFHRMSMRLNMNTPAKFQFQ